MSHDRPKRDSMSLEEATISNMWEIAVIGQVLKRKGLCTKQDLYDIITEFHCKNPHASIRVSVAAYLIVQPLFTPPVYGAMCFRVGGKNFGGQT